MLVLFLAACKHENWQTSVDDEKRTMNATEIHQKIPGTWTFDLQSDVSHLFQTMTLGTNGNLSLVCSNGVENVKGTWQLRDGSKEVTNDLGEVTGFRQVEDQGSCLVVMIAGTNYFYPVLYVDDRELVLAPGLSVVGRYRFTR